MQLLREAAGTVLPRQLPSLPRLDRDRLPRLRGNGGHLKHIRFHDLRHSCATALLEAGVDPKTVQNRLGHSDITMTLNIYAHCTQNMDRNAAQTLDDLFSGAV